MCDSRSCSHSSSQEGMRLDALIKVILIANDEAPVSGKRDGGGVLEANHAATAGNGEKVAGHGVQDGSSLQ